MHSRTRIQVMSGGQEPPREFNVQIQVVWRLSSSPNMQVYRDDSAILADVPMSESPWSDLVALILVKVYHIWSRYHPILPSHSRHMEKHLRKLRWTAVNNLVEVGMV